MPGYAEFCLAALAVCILLTIWCLPSLVIAVRDRRLDEDAQSAADFAPDDDEALHAEWAAICRAFGTTPEAMAAEYRRQQAETDGAA